MPEFEHKVAVCVPCMDMVHSRFWWSMQYLSSDLAEAQVFSTSSSYITTSRNLLVRQAKAWGATHVLFIDSDMTFPFNAIDRLLVHGIDVVGATYVKRMPPFDVICADKTIKGVDLVKSDGLVEIEEMPTGMLMIRSSVFDKVVRPWFRMRYKDECEEWPEGDEVGEDIGFCREVRKLGFRVWCDAGLSKEIGHLGVQEHKIVPARVETVKLATGRVA